MTNKNRNRLQYLLLIGIFSVSFNVIYKWVTNEFIIPKVKDQHRISINNTFDLFLTYNNQGELLYIRNIHSRYKAPYLNNLDFYKEGAIFRQQLFLNDTNNTTLLYERSNNIITGKMNTLHTFSKDCGKYHERCQTMHGLQYVKNRKNEFVEVIMWNRGEIEWEKEM